MRVSTVAGESPASAADRYTYAAPTAAGTGGGAAGGAGGTSAALPKASPAPARCKVPKLRSRKLKAAKKAIRRAGCKVGKVARADGVTAATGKVKTQRPKAGRSVAKGTKVAVRLG